MRALLRLYAGSVEALSRLCLGCTKAVLRQYYGMPAIAGLSGAVICLV
jgi:hypothetical protein